jgi:predicted RNase H-like HicB family nuclease
MNNNPRNKAKELACRPYTVEVVLDETTDGRPVYMARTPELEGCFGQGETIDDAVNNLYEARVDFIQSLLEDGLPIPNPSILATTTTASLTTTLTLRYKQSDTVNLNDTMQVFRQSEKPLHLFEGAIRA